MPSGIAVFLWQHTGLCNPPCQDQVKEAQAVVSFRLPEQIINS